MTEPSFPSPLEGETTDRPPADDAHTRGEDPQAEPAFRVDPVAAEVAERDRTTVFSPEGTADYNPAPTAARDAPLTVRPSETSVGGDRRAVELPDSVAGYEILGLLGRGGMGVVYQARQPGLKRIVALKMILSGPHADARELRRFRIEAEAVAQLQHVNIVQIYEVGEDEGRPYFSLEFIDGVLARANLGVMIMRLGNIALEVNGDALAARDYYQQGRDLQQEIHTHPRGDYPTDQSVILLSHHAMHLGWAYLRMGRPAEATKQFEESLRLRREWHELKSQRTPRTGESRSWITQALLWLGVADWHRGDGKASEEHFRQCLNLCEELIKEYPRDISYKSDLAEILQAHGDALVHRGRPEEAGPSYLQARKHLDVFLSHNPDDPTPLPLSALLYERLGADAQRRGQREPARKHYQEALRIRQDLSQVEPENRVWKAAYLLTLARCGRGAEALRGADQLRRQADRSAELLLQLARCYAVCGKPDKAREALGALGKLDFHDDFLLRTDPDLAPLQSNPNASAKRR